MSIEQVVEAPIIPHSSEWHKTRIGDLLESGILFAKNGFAQGGFNETGEGVPHLRPFNISNQGIVDLSQIKFVPPPAPESPYWTQTNDIIFNNTNTEELVGKTALFDLSGKYTLSNHMTLLRVVDKARLDAEWLAKLLHYFWSLGVFRGLCRRHVNQASISLQRLGEVEIPLPPLADQRAIASTLRAAQAAVQARRRAVELERERKAALMQLLFTKGTRGEATKMTEIGEVPESWEVKPIGYVAEVAYGLTVNQNRRASRRQVPLLTVANVSRGALHLEVVREIGVLEGDEERYRLQRDDVLIVEGNGNPKLLGSAAIWRDELPLALHQNHLIRVRANQAVVLAEWIMNYLNSDDGIAQLFGRSTTSSGLHSINSRLISELQLPLPPLTEQREIAETLRACDEVIAGLEREAALHEELFRALLEELMTGRVRVPVQLGGEGTS